MRGRKPKPTALKLVGGNPGKRPLSGNEPKPESVPPTCPATLQGEARTEWRRVIKEMNKMNLLARVDRAALAAYCQAWGRWVEAEDQVRKRGPVVKSPKGYPMQNPYLSIANRAMEQMLKAGVEFGFTPSSRTRIKVDPQAKEDPMEIFLRRGTRA